MRYITRIHLSDCGWKEAYYPGTTIDLTNPRTDKPIHTVFNMENTGGKTSFLSLVLSCFDTSERRFLKTLIHSHQKFGQYFGDVPAFILVEWDLSDDQGSLLEAPRLITGQIVVPLGQGQQREYERHFFTFRSTPELTLEDLPAPGLVGFARGRLNGRQDVQRWLYEMRSALPGNFQVFDNQKNWKRKLAEENIDADLLAVQVDFNRSEGGIEDFLNFRDEAQFVRKFLQMIVPDEEAGEVREVLVVHVNKLADRPKLVRRRDAMRQLKEQFAPFAAIADELQLARVDVDRQRALAAGLRTALAARGDQAAKLAEQFVAAATEHGEAAKDAAAKCLEARALYASAIVETARRNAAAASALAKGRANELEQARTRKRLLMGAVLLREIHDDRVRSEAIQRDIDSRDAELEPRRNQLRVVGADLHATLERRAASARQQQRLRGEEAKKQSADAEAADKSRAIAEENARDARQAAGRLEAMINRASDSREALVRDQVLLPNESAFAAVERHERSALSYTEQATDLDARAEAKALVARENVASQSDRKAERSGFQGEIKPLRSAAEAGEAKRRELAFHPTTLKLAGETEVDPDGEVVARVLAGARREAVGALRNAERQREVLEADRESLEAVGLASIDKDARSVAERLREAGIRDAQPYAGWLSTILASPADVRRFAETDPARFVGVAVPDRKGLERAREALRLGPPISRPVVVAIASGDPKDLPDDRFVMPVDRAAAYDREASRKLQQEIEGELGEITGTINKHQERTDHLDAVGREYALWREQFGHGRLVATWREIEQRQSQIAELDIAITSLSEQIAANERDARDLREQAKTTEAAASAALERTRRAREYHREWETHLEGWSAELRLSEQTSENAERLARDEAARRDRLRGEAQELIEEAKVAGNAAASHEREAAEIEYKTRDGRSADALDALRRDYHQHLETLRSLESNRVDHLRGQKKEIDKTLAQRERRFEREHGDLDRNQVEAEAARDGVYAAAEAAESAIEKAQAAASDASSEANRADQEYQSEKVRQARDVRPKSIIDLRDLDQAALVEAEKSGSRTLEEEQAREARENEAARQARGESERSRRISEDCRHHIANLLGILVEMPVAITHVSLPRDEEVAELVSRTVAELARVSRRFHDLRESAYGQYDLVRKFTTSETFRQLEAEREVAAHLYANDPLAAAASARRTERLIDDRLKTIDHDISRLDDDLETCVAELLRLLGTALHCLRKMTSDGRIPDHVPRFGGQPVFRMSGDLSRVPQAQRKEMLVNYVTDLADTGRIPETGHDIAAELVGRMTAALGRQTLGIQLLKPKGEGDTEHMPIDRVTVSGGELLTAAMMIYLVIARLRATARQGRSADGGILIMDNPFGKANKALLLKTQIGLADAMGIQLFYTTGVQDTSALAEFENIVRLRRSKQSTTTRRIHVEAMRVLIDKQTGVEQLARPTTAAAAE